MSNERYKLHPISAVINFIKGLKDLIFPFVIIFVANGFQGDSTGVGHWTDYIPYIAGTVVLVFLLFSGLIKWKRFVYWFEDNELRIEYGLFVKKKRYIPIDRIQSLNYTEGIFHRPFQLVKVTIETAGSGAPKEAEAELTAITKGAAKRIEEELSRAKKRKLQKPMEERSELDLESAEEARVGLSKPLFTLSMKDLIVLATTSGGIGIMFSGIAVFASQFSDLIPYELIYDEVMVFLKFGFFIVAISIFAVLLAAWAVSVVVTTINYYQFTIFHEDGQIIMTRGLLEKKKVTIPINRVQGIRIVENPLRQLFGYCTVIVESAGGSLEDKDQNIRLFPLVKKSDMVQPLNELFPALELKPNWSVAPKRAKSFYYRLDFVWMIPVIVLVSYFYFPYGLLSLLILPIMYAFALYQHRAAGIAITQDQLSLRYRAFSRNTFFIEKKRMQSATMKQSRFQKRKSLASFQTTVKSGLLGVTARVEHMQLEDIEHALSWYEPSRHNAKKEGQPN